MTGILVVGATGTVGQGVAEGLAKQGTTVFAATRDQRQYDGPGTPRHLDLSDSSTFPAALEGVSTVFQVSPGGHADAYGLLEPFIRAMPEHNVSRVIAMTAQGVEVSDDIPLRRVELAIEASGLRWAHLRPTWFSQNFQSYWGEPLKHGVIPLPAGDSRTAFLDTRDISNAALAVLNDDSRDGTAWELTGPEALTYEDAARVLSEATGRTIRYQNVSDDEFRTQLLGAGMADDYVGLLLNLFAAVRAGGASAVLDTVQTLTGNPPRTLRQYASDHREVL
ncbi:MAG: SDR family oxidoreductase [Myxococcota bacterium]